MKQVNFILIGVVVIIYACTPATNTTRFVNYPPKSSTQQIRIYRTTLPNQEYEEIGIVSARQRNKFITMDAVVESIKEQARQMGGDAIIGLSIDNESQALVGGTIDRDPVLSGTVIRFIRDR